MKKSFITVTPDRGQNNGTLSVNADTNENCVSRYDTFKVEGGGITKSVSIEQNPNPYVYIDCGYIFSSANIQEPYEVIHNGPSTILRFDIKFANFILSSKNRFVIKNVSSLPVNLKNPVIGSIVFLDANDQYLGTISIPLNEFTTEFIHNPENQCMTLSIIDITPAKLNEIVAKINYAHEASPSGNMGITISIESTDTPDNLLIMIHVS